MTDANQTLLRRSLLASYSKLRDRLARRLGSLELAGEALNETWLRIETTSEGKPVSNPEAYLYRAALNTASNIRRSQERRLSEVEIESVLNLADEAPGPDRILAAREEVAIVNEALAELPERQRIVFRESFLGTTNIELAARLGVTPRTISSDLQRAVAHCARRLGSKNFFRSGGVAVSANKEGASS